MRNVRKLIITISIIVLLAVGVISFFSEKRIPFSKPEEPHVLRSPLIHSVKSSVKIINGIPRLVINDSTPIPFIGFQLYPSFSPYVCTSTIWKERIDYLSNNGFTYVCLWLFWPLMDAHKTGLPENAADWINWTPLDEFFDYAAEKGVYVIPHFWFDYAPEWWYKKYGDKYVQVSNEGQKSGIGSQLMICFNATEAHWKYVDQVLTALINRYKKHPALLGWALAVGSSAENNYPGGNLYEVRGWYDYSNFSRMQFRSWLRRVYDNNVLALRKAWKNNTVTFENAEIPQPLSPTDPTIAAVNSGGDNRRQFYDWQLFRLEQKKANREHFGRLYKQLDPNHIVLTMALFPFWGGLTEKQGVCWPAVAAFDYYDVINAPYIDGVILNPPINQGSWFHVRWSFLYALIKYAHSRGKIISPFFEDFGVDDELWIIDSFIYFASALGSGIGWVEGREGKSQTPWSEVEREEIAKCWYLSQSLPLNKPRRDRFALIDSPVLLSMDYQRKGEWTGYKALDLVGVGEMLADAGLEFDVLTEHDIIADPSILNNYSAVALISLFRISDELTDILVKYRDNGGGLFIAGRTAVFDKYGNYNMTYLQRLLGVSQPLQEYKVDSGESWSFVAEDESGLIRGIEGKRVDSNNIYYIPIFDYEDEDYKIIGRLDSNPKIGVVGYRNKTVFWFSRLGEPWGIFQPDPITFKTILQFMRNLYDYYSIPHDEMGEYWIENIGGQYKFILTNKVQGFNGPVSFNLRNFEESFSDKYIIYNWAEMSFLAVASADENGIIRTNLTLKRDEPILLEISKCTANPRFLAAKWAVLQEETWDRQTQTLKINLYAKINKEVQIAVYLAERTEEAVNVVGGNISRIERDEKSGVLKITFKPNRDCVTVELLFPGGAYSWLIDGAIYEVNLEYFPNHKFSDLTKMIPYLERLGVKTIYLLPIWECISQYLILDYYKINPRYGDASDLKELVKTAHKHGIRIILDLVTSLTPEGSYIFTNHPDWILRGDNGEMQRYFPFTDWGWAIDCANPEVIDYFTEVAKYYVKEFDIDGWRIDSPLNNYDPKKVSGDHSRLNLLRSVKSAITNVKPYAILCAEVSGPTMYWGDVPTEAEPLFDEMCEISYNYAFCGFLSEVGYYNIGKPFIEPGWEQSYTETMLNKIAHNRATSEEFVNFVLNQRILYNRLRANFIENHDTARVSQVFPNQHRPLFVLIATMPGVPVIHAGQEIGAKTRPEEGGRGVVNWEEGDKDLLSFYIKVLKIRSENKALRYGNISNVWSGGDNIIAFLRNYEDNYVIVALNFGSETARSNLSIPIDELGLNPGKEYILHDELNDETFILKGENLKKFELVLPPYGSRIIVIK